MATQHIICIGDIHSDLLALERMTPVLAQATALVVTGDLTERGTRAEVERVVQALRAVNPALHVLPGNMDAPETPDWLDELGVNLHRRVVEVEGYQLAGVGFSSPTPFGTRGEVPDATLGRWLDELPVDRVDDNLLLITHDPPQGTALDRLPDSRHVGSVAVRNYVERVGPLVCVSGHIHEAVGTDSIVSTSVANPGLFARGGFARIILANPVSLSVEYVA